MFDNITNSAEALFHFIEATLDKLESVLVHSVKGQSRASSVIAAYLMRKYRWGLLKTLEFLNSRRPDLEIRASFIHQLSALEGQLIQKGLLDQNDTTVDWSEILDKEIEDEETLLRNTFVNS